MDDVFNEMWDQFVKEGFDQPESMKESCYCIAKRYHELERGVASPVHNQVSQSGEAGSKGGPQNHKEWICPTLMGLIADEYGRKGDKEAVRTCVEIMRQMKW